MRLDHRQSDPKVSGEQSHREVCLSFSFWLCRLITVCLAVTTFYSGNIRFPSLLLTLLVILSLQRQDLRNGFLAEFVIWVASIRSFQFGLRIFIALLVYNRVLFQRRFFFYKVFKGAANQRRLAVDLQFDSGFWKLLNFLDVLQEVKFFSEWVRINGLKGGIMWQ